MIARRSYLHLASTLWMPCSAALVGKSEVSNAALFDNADHRQLELCIVSLQRTLFWAEKVRNRLKDNNASDSSKKAAYLEAKLGAKAILTGKVGGGASIDVYTVAKLQIPGCLDDMVHYKSSVSESKREFIESLAGIVEFDGYDSLTDPSPRSTLTLSQYSESKALFVRRLLDEKVLFWGNRIIQSFDEGSRSRAASYIDQYYSGEKPLTGDIVSTTGIGKIL